MARQLCEKHSVHYDTEEGCPICLEEPNQTPEQGVVPITQGKAKKQAASKATAAKKRVVKRRRAG